MPDPIEIIPFTADHLDGAVVLSKEAGWPHRREDWDLSRILSHGFVATDGHRVLGTIFATPLDDRAATINMVIVDASLRGQGIGKRLMATAIDATEGRECRLVATQDGLPLYEKLGFERTGEVLQHQGPLSIAGLSSPSPDLGPDLGEVDWATTTDHQAIRTLDRDAHGLERIALLDALEQVGRLAVLRRNGLPVGYACLRPFGRGEVVGPVIAGTLEEAKALITFLLAPRETAFIRVDTDRDSGLAPWLESLGLSHVGGGVRMTRPATTTPPLPARTAATHRVFALVSQALG
ncbi:GNAT family N-acetyltransferase [Rhodospirillum sp. A1_3_36]|uniref:GNAT family N-acetyltransferase n=1 Tax=Rhodospirillum sp. A1_3_36 TaxID=3391666 RepID=UPI0039A6D431